MHKSFLTIKLEGSRYDNHSIPLEVLSDFLSFQKLLFEEAKALIKSDKSGDRIRAPRNFTKGLHLSLLSISQGSAVAELALVKEKDGAAESQQLPFPDQSLPNEAYFHKAVLHIQNILEDLLNENQPIDNERDLSKIHNFVNRITLNLKDDETISWGLAGGVSSISLDKAKRDRILKRSAGDDLIQSEFELCGKVVSVDKTKPKREFKLLKIDGRHISIALPNKFEEIVVQALGSYDSEKASSTGIRLAVIGLGCFDTNGEFAQTIEIESIEALPNTVFVNRVLPLMELKAGWMEGDGSPLSIEGLNWLTTCIENFLPDEFPVPGVYPTPDGNILFEWISEQWDVSLEVDLENQTGYFHLLDKISDEDSEEDLNLSIQAHWDKVTRQIFTLFGINNEK